MPIKEEHVNKINAKNLNNAPAYKLTWLHARNPVLSVMYKKKMSGMNSIFVRVLIKHKTNYLLAGMSNIYESGISDIFVSFRATYL